MPELPEVEVLCRYLNPKLMGQTIRSIKVFNERSIRPHSVNAFVAFLKGRKIRAVTRRAKFIQIHLEAKGERGSEVLLCHLGMTGRLFLLQQVEVVPKHAAVLLGLGREVLVFQDVRQFGRMTHDLTATGHLGPEPLSVEFPEDEFLARIATRQAPIKTLLLDQSLIAGIGNIYASEALFVAKILPHRPGAGLRGLFYFGSGKEVGNQVERFCVYGRAGEPCRICKTRIEKSVIGARSTYFCPRCQR